MHKYDAIVAGAGIWGCTVARRLAEAGKRVPVLEKRPVVGGNMRCDGKKRNWRRKTARVDEWWLF